MGNCFGAISRSPTPVDATPSSTGRSTSRTSGSETTTGKLSSFSSSSTTLGQSAGSGVSVEEVFREGRILEAPNLRVYTFAELRSSTRNFKPECVLGEGGFGKVYKGWVEEKTLNPSKSGVGTMVAVKKLNPESVQGLEEWQSEVNFLGRLSHPNLVKLLGYCWEDKELLLVYEYMPSGSLENHLFKIHHLYLHLKRAYLDDHSRDKSRGVPLFPLPVFAPPPTAVSSGPPAIARPLLPQSRAPTAAIAAACSNRERSAPPPPAFASSPDSSCWPVRRTSSCSPDRRCPSTPPHLARRPTAARSPQPQTAAPFLAPPSSPAEATVDCCNRVLPLLLPGEGATAIPLCRRSPCSCLRRRAFCFSFCFFDRLELEGEDR